MEENTLINYSDHLSHSLNAELFKMHQERINSNYFDNFRPTFV